MSEADTTAQGAVAAEVQRRILDQIRDSALGPGQRLGGERDLATAFGVSRSSVRLALAALERTGAVRRVAGRGGGTFVGSPKVDRDLSRIVGVPQLLRRQGMQAGTRVLGTGLVVADTPTAAALGLPDGAHVLDIVRIRLADGTPISLEHARLPAALFPGLLELPLGGSLYELLEEHFDTRPHDAVEHIEVVTADEHEAAVLAVPRDAPLLSITRTTRNHDGTAFEHSHDLFRADRTSITVRSFAEVAMAAVTAG
ncbi:GntR family transcriptional regulator [Dactylosporangium vinaceum]|uniref:GntR family transcriptional regulator n=1 Tax=Dactylosporangium vinaceum TaxID=53362 RepID=A0ABV5M3E2_9ACTN|nr:GntR family transcriptional regulator [Dactylosporangium vinaceum]UAB99704.1 GntR family transcriptional regulator [Dactylosporangium vinaceum]